MERLPLQKFVEVERELTSEQFNQGVKRLERLGWEIRLFTSWEQEDDARNYMEMLEGRGWRIEVVEDVLAAAREAEGENVLPLFIKSAIDPKLKEDMFRPENRDLLMFGGANYSKHEKYDLPVLSTIGTTRANIGSIVEVIPGSSMCELEAYEANRLKSLHGKEMVTPFDFRMAAEQASKMRIHALGPEGTNIAQVGKRLIEQYGRQGSELIVHPAGVEPFDYAEYASRFYMGDPESLQAHVECAVFYAMRELFMERSERGEIVFADHHQMKLDSMQLARQAKMEGVENGEFEMASHPSPASLVADLVESGQVRMSKASSNSDAAEKVAKGEADACITTRSAARRYGLETTFDFGRPNMMFTIGTPLSMEALLELSKTNYANI